MHNARRGEFTLPMANRKSSANIRQETFFEPGRLSPFLEKCVDEKYCTGAPGNCENSLGGRRDLHSFISEHFQLPAGREIGSTSELYFTAGVNSKFATDVDEYSANRSLFARGRLF